MSSKLMYKSSHINRDSGGGVKKSGTSPGIGGHGRLYDRVGLNGMLLRNQIVQGTTNTPYFMGSSCPVTAAQSRTIYEKQLYENAIRYPFTHHNTDVSQNKNKPSTSSLATMIEDKDDDDDDDQEKAIAANK